MKYDFTSIMDRRGKDAIAVDGLGTGFAPDLPKDGFDIIPMWVADMNFPTVPTIPEAIIERAKHPAFGYFQATDEYYDSIIQWQATRNGVTGLTKEAIGYENGVLGGVISALTAFAAPGDGVLLHSPTYIGFTMSINNNGYKIVHSPLKKDENGIWRMDYEDMDAKLKAEKIHVAVFCSPHNPCGRVWERWELEKAMEVYKANDCIVISDEIWSDIILEGYKHIPTQSVSDWARQNTVAVYAPSKTFNLAGLQISNIFIPNEKLRKAFQTEIDKTGYDEPNALGIVACEAAYRAGEDWLDQLRAYLLQNLNFLREYLQEKIPQIHLVEPEGTYLVWLDCSELGITGKELDQFIVDKAGLWLDGGSMFGPSGAAFQRVNIACPQATLELALNKLKAAVDNLE